MRDQESPETRGNGLESDGPALALRCCGTLFKALSSLVKWASHWEDPGGVRSESGPSCLSKDWLLLFTDSK